MPGPTILFISHEASYTGAPNVLLQFLQWLRHHTDVSPYILLRRGGPAEFALGRLGPMLIYSQSSFWQQSRLRRALQSYSLDKRLCRFRLRVMRRQWLQQNVRLVYSNTVCGG